MNIMKNRVAAVAAGAIVLAGFSGVGGAVAGDLIGSKDIKDGAVHGVDLSKGVNSRLDSSLPYGIAQVKVQRGTGTATPWAVYSNTVGGPQGDTTGGTFRFTCSVANAPCKVSVAAYGTQDGMTVYPRVDIMKENADSGAMTHCEYGDGTDNNGGSATLSTEPKDMTLGIGGSDDCGLNGPSGSVDAITVGVGYYDVTSTFQFAS